MTPLQGSSRGLAGLAQLIEAIPARAVILDAGLGLIAANGAFASFFGLTTEALGRRTLAEIIGPEPAASLHRLAVQTRGTGLARREGWSTDSGDRRLYVEETVVPVDGGYVACVRDLTDLKTSEAMNAAIIAAALDCIVVIDETGMVVEFNPSAESAFGYRRDEVIGRPISEMIVPPAWRARHGAGMKRYLETGVASVLDRRVEIEAMRSDGLVFPAELTVTEVKQPGRRLFTAHLRDLSEPKRAAEELRLQRERLHQVEKLSAMGSLLAGVAHELNNPLAVVVAQATLLSEKAGDAATKDRAKRLHAAAERCGRIVKSFLAMARQKQGQREILDLNTVVAASLEMLSYGLRSAAIAVTMTLDPQLRPIEADRDLISQVVANLIINAQQALTDRAAPRRLELTTGNLANMVLLTVSDNGPGISEQAMTRIFDPYFTTKPAGTGIGLSICKTMVEAHGGRLEARHGAEGGAIFVVTLPAGEGAIPAGIASRTAPAKARRILVIDDEPEVAASLGDMLEALGHHVVVMGSPPQALDIIDRGGIEAVFADLRMPSMSGAEFRQLVRGRDPALAARTVIMTGDSIRGRSDIAAATEGGPIHFLEKPFTLDDLRRAVDGVFGAAPSEEAAQASTSSKT